MAILMAYRTVSETDREVRYEYGHPEMDRHLTFNKVADEVLMEDGQEDHGTRAVIRRIVYRLKTEDQGWPNGGGIQS